MSIAELAVKHRVTVAMAILVVVLLGAVAYGRIPLDLLPSFDFPVIGVLTTATGAAPEEIEALLTRPLEEIVGTVPNIKSIQSTSSEGTSMIIAQFNWGTDMDFAALELRERIDLVRSAFPDDVTPPLVVKFDPSLLPVMTITLTGGGNQVELRNLASDIVKQRLERIEGVASVAVIGGQEELIRVTVDPVKLAQHSISWTQLTLAMTTASLNLPGGRVSEDGKDYLIRSLGSVKNLQELADVVVGADLPAGIASGLGGGVSAGSGTGAGAAAAGGGAQLPSGTQLPNGLQLPAGFTLPAGMSLSEAWRLYQQWQAQSGNGGGAAICNLA
jgi:HAE1 family hydrophobic/amphiphilic exporter-1